MQFPSDPATRASKYLEAAQTEALSATPEAQPDLLCAYIEGGDPNPLVVDAALTAFGDTTSYTTNHLAPFSKKQLMATRLAHALAGAGTLDIAYNVADELALHEPGSAFFLRADMLCEGYTDHQGEFLDSVTAEDYPRPELSSDPGELSLLSSRTCKYLQALASIGVDVAEQDTSAARLIESHDAASDDNQKQRLRASLVHGYTNATRFDLAYQYADALADPFARLHAYIIMSDRVTEVERLREIADKVDAAMLDAELTALTAPSEASRDELPNIGEDGTLGARSLEDVYEELGMLGAERAVLYARVGRLEEARSFLDTCDQDRFGVQCQQIFTDLYAAEGREEDRVHALALLRSHVLPENIEGRVRTLAAADVQVGQTFPPIGTDSGSLPLIAWEVHGAFTLSADQLDEVEGFGVLEANTREEYAAQVRKQHAFACGALALIAAQADAPLAAHELLEKIDIPAHRIRTQVKLGTHYRDTAVAA